MSIRCIVGLGTLVPSLAVVSAHAQITPQGSLATVRWSIDGLPEATAYVSGVMAADGDLKFAAEYNTPEGLRFTLEYLVDPMSELTAIITGNVRCFNATSQPHNVNWSIEFPFCPSSSDGTLFGGMVTLLVETNADGGGVSCAPGALSLWNAVIDGEEVHNAFYCPFQMTTTGSGSMRATHVFGAPIPSLAGPPSAPTAGSMNRFRITGGDAIRVTSTLTIMSLGSIPVCSGDLNGDGIVDGEDLTLILGNWDAGHPCSVADLTGDGIVDGRDVAILLGQWGLCPG